MGLVTQDNTHYNEAWGAVTSRTANNPYNFPKTWAGGSGFQGSPYSLPFCTGLVTLAEWTKIKGSVPAGGGPRVGGDNTPLNVWLNAQANNGLDKPHRWKLIKFYLEIVYHAPADGKFMCPQFPPRVPFQQPGGTFTQLGYNCPI